MSTERPEAEREARARGEQVTTCPVCGELVADPLLWAHEERHARETAPTPGAGSRERAAEVLIEPPDVEAAAAVVAWWFSTEDARRSVLTEKIASAVAHARAAAEARGYERGRAEMAGKCRELADEAYRVSRALSSALIAVSRHLDQPYPDAPQWTPWTRFVRDPVVAVRDVADRLRFLLADSAPGEPS